MGRIKICAAEEQVGKTVSSARDEFLQYCRLRNLSPRTIEFCREDINYFIRWAKFKFADDITKDVLDNFVIHEMDKGNRIAAINSRIRGIRVFVRFCKDREYLEGFKISLLKENQEQKEPYTDAELKRLLKKPKPDKRQEWRCWAIVNLLLAAGIRANTVIHLKILCRQHIRQTICKTAPANH